ncbi:MAG TPA: polysaccharide deacetylase family protein [Candidatus Nanopelagicales bacterium]|nr:polysaccharide deacetylase family protein [Candidatus Nanopelagicales bacterium]
MSDIKGALLGLLTLPGMTRSLSFLMRDRAAIFMLHRFSDPERGIRGEDEPEALRQALAFLRRERFQLLSLEEVFRRLGGEGPPLERAVAFTLDDGTIDQALVAAPIFAEFDCPATTFVVTGYLDGKLWLWWDKIEHVFEATDRRALRVTLGGEEIGYQWEDAAGRARAITDFTERCKRVADGEKHAAIERLAAEAGVELPALPPLRYAPMSWDDLRACEARGMSFGPHTVTHPILARTEDAQSEQEIQGSWERLSAEARRPVPIFCPPNGLVHDYGAREMVTLERLGLRGAVLASPPRYADAASFRSSPEARFRVPRVDFTDDLAYLARTVSGARRLREIVPRRSPRGDRLVG